MTLLEKARERHEEVDPKTYRIDDEVEHMMFLYSKSKEQMREIEARMIDRIRTELGTAGT